mmetsp:Transcript_76857/g.222102  ORF Transcript_76857/g.222102 Transcript_76857/m.222102 type:complete len:303 (+) Transcript_76857:450-1358(+)
MHMALPQHPTHQAVVRECRLEAIHSFVGATLGLLLNERGLVGEHFHEPSLDDARETDQLEEDEPHAPHVRGHPVVLLLRDFRCHEWKSTASRPAGHTFRLHHRRVEIDELRDHLPIGSRRQQHVLGLDISVAHLRARVQVLDRGGDLPHQRMQLREPQWPRASVPRPEALEQVLVAGVFHSDVDVRRRIVDLVTPGDVRMSPTAAQELHDLPDALELPQVASAPQHRLADRLHHLATWLAPGASRRLDFKDLPEGSPAESSPHRVPGKVQTVRIAEVGAHRRQGQAEAGRDILPQCHVDLLL